jgi:DNA-binding MarR family transcriptional regulator
MRRLGTIDLEILHLSIKENGTFNENNLENSELKRYGVGKILDTLASLKDRKFITLNSDGSFSITELSREILWSDNIPIWGKILRLLQIKSCSFNEIIDILQVSENKILNEIEKLRKSQFILMSPQRKNEKLIKMYEILSEGIQEIDKTDTEGFNQIQFGEIKPMGEILEISEDIIKKIKNLEISEKKKENIIEQIIKLKNKLEI